MNRRKTGSINILANVIGPIAVVLITIAIFFIFKPENPDVLFWFNMAYSSLLEIILFAYIVWLPDNEGSVVLKWMCGVFSVIYVSVSLLWMLLFSMLFCRWWSLKVYFSVIAVLTVLWFFIGATTMKVDHIVQTSNKILKKNRVKMDDVINNAGMILEQFNFLSIAHSELIQAKASIVLLCRGLTTLSPSIFSDEDTVERINAIIHGLKNILDMPISEMSSYNMKEYADKSIIILNSIKNKQRK